jgi:hypothetical protein
MVFFVHFVVFFTYFIHKIRAFKLNKWYISTTPCYIAHSSIAMTYIEVCNDKQPSVNLKNKMFHWANKIFVLYVKT